MEGREPKSRKDQPTAQLYTYVAAWRWWLLMTSVALTHRGRGSACECGRSRSCDRQQGSGVNNVQKGELQTLAVLAWHFLCLYKSGSPARGSGLRAGAVRAGPALEEDAHAGGLPLSTPQNSYTLGLAPRLASPGTPGPRRERERETSEQSQVSRQTRYRMC
jgi:hypothetical protein